MRPHLTVKQRQLARWLSAKGLSLREIGRQVGCSHEVVRTVVRRESKRPLRSDSWRPGPGRPTLADRAEISLGLRGGDSFTAISARLGKATSTVSREVAANGGRHWPTGQIRTFRRLPGHAARHWRGVDQPQDRHTGLGDLGQFADHCGDQRTRRT
jgi:IS30 family transposase